MEKLPTILTIKDVQKMLGVSQTTIYNYMDVGILPYRQIGKFRRFTIEDVNVLLKNCSKNSTCPGTSQN